MGALIRRNRKRVIVTVALILALTLFFVLLYPIAVEWLGNQPAVAYYKLTRLETMIREEHIYATEDDRPLLRAYQLYTETDETPEDGELREAILEILEDDIENYYELANLALGDYDHYSRLRTKEQYSAAFPDSESYEGLGITISGYGPFVYIGKVIADSNAGRAGLQAGDLIFSLDGEDIRDTDYETVREKIAAIGGEAVSLGVLRDGERLFFDVSAGAVRVPNVSHEIDGDVGILTVTLFQEDSFKADIDAAVADFRAAGIEKLIVDLRDNRGGYINYAVYLLSALMSAEDEPLFAQTKRDGDKTFLSEGGGLDFEQIEVLVNGDTYSAAEISSGSLGDRGAELIGTTTYGKAVGLTTYDFFGDELSLATLTVKLPESGDYNEKGIEPDIYIENELVYHEPIEPLPSAPVDETSGAGEIEALETCLSALGYLDGEADGVWDAVTEAALAELSKLAGETYTDNCTIELITVINRLTAKLSAAAYQEDTQLMTAYERLEEAASVAA